jgi:pyruvate-formate lyase-activating enzyme
MYYFDGWDEGVAQRVRAEREDGIRRVLETIYWWPAREGKEWPATVVPIPEWTGVGEEADAWAHFEATLGMDERYRWEPLPDE